MKKSLIFLLAFCSLLAGCGKNNAISNESMTDNMTSNYETVSDTEAGTKKISKVSADEEIFTSYIKLNGRYFYRKDSKAFCFNYSLGGFEFKFYGTGAKARLVSKLSSETNEKNPIMYVYVDDMTEPFSEIYINETNAQYVLAENLPEGEHHIRLAKRTDISYSDVGVYSVDVTGENATFLEPPSQSERKILFLGDSITSGDGLLSTDGSGSYISKYQDAKSTYASVTASYFGAEPQIVSRCGLGLIWNSSSKAPEDGAISLPMIFDYSDYYYDSTKTKWEHSSFVPDIIVINIGTNDSRKVTSSDENKKRFTDTYEEFLGTVRQAYPDVPIICCYGAMVNDIVDLGVEDVVKNVTSSGMKDVYYLRFPKNKALEFGFGVGNHPTAAKHKYDAEEYLIPLIKTVLGWE